jgi:cell division septal protein FtsQ
MKKKIKDELRQVWIKNHNMEASFASIKLLLIVNLMCVILLFLTTIWFIIFKLNEL